MELAVMRRLILAFMMLTSVLLQFSVLGYLIGVYLLISGALSGNLLLIYS